MSDFAVRVKRLPESWEFEGSEHQLKANLWKHFEDLMREEGEAEYEIADICFGKHKIVQTTQLMKLYNIFKQIQILECNRDSVVTASAKLKAIEAKISEAREVYEKEKENYRKQMDLMKEDANDSDEDDNVKYAYVVFRSMKARDGATQLFNLSSFYRYFILTFCCSCFCKNSRESLKKRYFYDKWLKVDKACQPDEIKWENIGYSLSNRRCRRVLIHLVALLLVVVGLCGLLYTKSEADDFQTTYDPHLNCPDTVSKEEAFNDEMKAEAKIGLMHCYCLEFLRSDLFSNFD
mmetsp:Transcript_28134/g.42552  ORF Transcript_28134/g.42552 Transcript_28134/m.42552 type:complete len:292 (-) Transcript_28134:1600-2475(-)